MLEAPRLPDEEAGSARDLEEPTIELDELSPDEPTVVDAEPQPQQEEDPMSLAQRVKQFGSLLNWRQLRRMYNSYKAQGKTPEQAAELVGAFLDETFPFDEMVPGEVGETMEKLDGEAFRAAVRVLIAVILIFTARGVSGQ